MTIDGARWQEVFGGSDPAFFAGAPRRPEAALVPNLHRLATEDGAAIGAPEKGVISATGPHFVSLPGYTELLTGRAPTDCPGDDCARTRTPTILDEVHAAGGKVAAFASWETLDRAVSQNPGAFVSSCGQSPKERHVDPAPGSGSYRPDRVTGELALSYFDRERPDAFFLGLGDTDEHGHNNDYAGYLGALTQADAIVGKLAARLDTLERMDGRPTTLIVTADHGRARDFAGHGGWAPESARVWLIATSRPRRERARRQRHRRAFCAEPPR